MCVLQTEVLVDGMMLLCTFLFNIMFGWEVLQTTVKSQPPNALFRKTSNGIIKILYAKEVTIEQMMI